MKVHELAEKIAILILDRGHVCDEDIADEFGVDDFEVVKAKNVLCRYHGIAVERWHRDGEESRQAVFLAEDFRSDDAAELIHKVFHDPDFKTRRRMKEEERKADLRGEVKELFERLQEEWVEPFNVSPTET